MTADNPELVPRTARRDWACVCADAELRPGRRNPYYRSGCQKIIKQGERYVAYLGEAAAYRSGERYCLRCAAAVWDYKDPS